MHRYRSHTCGALRDGDIGQDVRLSGWCHRIRDHGGVLFIDLRDHYGITQCVADPDSPAFAEVEKFRSEWVVRIDGRVRRRPEGTDNPELPTGTVEVYIKEIEVLGPAAELPLQNTAKLKVSSVPVPTVSASSPYVVVRSVLEVAPTPKPVAPLVEKLVLS